MFVASTLGPSTENDIPGASQSESSWPQKRLRSSGMEDSSELQNESSMYVEGPSRLSSSPSISPGPPVARPLAAIVSHTNEKALRGEEGEDTSSSFADDHEGAVPTGDVSSSNIAATDTLRENGTTPGDTEEDTFPEGRAQVPGLSAPRYEVDGGVSISGGRPGERGRDSGSGLTSSTLPPPYSSIVYP